MIVAALYVLPDGPYASLPDVDLWDEARDARLYAGPHPVVAHPPCQRWGNLWWSAQVTRAGRRPNAPGLGEDGGCFEAALASVRRWGGVLEHPEGSRAWARFGLPVPSHEAGWVRSLFDPGWSCSVDQGRYGHRARKRTWLYYCGAATPAELDWRPAESTVWVCSGPGGRTAEERAAKGIVLLQKREHEVSPPPIRVPTAVARSRVPVEHMRKRERAVTPDAFAEALLALVRGAQ